MMIQNDGQRIVTSDYWQSQHSRDGYVYLSPNAGAWRLLVPENWQHLKEIKGAKGVALTRGRYQGLNCIEILFDDESDSPFALWIGLNMVERIPTTTDLTLRQFYVYGPNAEILASFNCVFRVAKSLPYLNPWKDA